MSLLDHYKEVKKIPPEMYCACEDCVVIRQEWITWCYEKLEAAGPSWGLPDERHLIRGVNGFDNRLAIDDQDLHEFRIHFAHHGRDTASHADTFNNLAQNVDFWEECVLDATLENVVMESTRVLAALTLDAPVDGDQGRKARVSRLFEAIEIWFKGCARRPVMSLIGRQLRELRWTCIIEETPSLFNDALRRFKRRLLAGELVVDHWTAWHTIQGGNVRLIQQGDARGQCRSGGVTLVDALMFHYDTSYVDRSSPLSPNAPAPQTFVCLAVRSRLANRHYSLLPRSAAGDLTREVKSLIDVPEGWGLMPAMLGDIRCFAVDSARPMDYNSVIHELEHRLQTTESGRAQYSRLLSFNLGPLA